MVTFSVARGSGACNVQCCLQSCLVSHMAEESQDSPFSNGERARQENFTVGDTAIILRSLK